MRTFAIVNRKGGVGKTTTAVELSYILATCCRKRVLLVDADSQANATTTLLFRGSDGDGLAAVLEGTEGYYEILIEQTDIPGLDILPATDALGELDMRCLTGDVKANFFALKEFVCVLAEDQAYDVVVIDCPPYYSLSCVNAIAACDSIIIPVGTDVYSAVGMNKLIQQIDSIREVCPNVRVSGCLVTKWHKADVVSDALNLLKENSPIPVFDNVIRRTDKVEEASWSLNSVQGWSPFSSAARDYRAWVAELLAKEGMK